MSGIALPMVHSNKVISGLSDPIGIEHIIDIAVVDAVATGTGGGASYNIVFVVNAGNTPREVIWRFVDASTRDTEMTALLADVSLLVTA